MTGLSSIILQYSSDLSESNNSGGPQGRTDSITARTSAECSDQGSCGLPKQMRARRRGLTGMEKEKMAGGKNETKLGADGTPGMRTREMQPSDWDSRSFYKL